MGNLQSDLKDRVTRFFGMKPTDVISDERREEVAQVAWWMIESDSAKADRAGAKRMSRLIGAALPAPESPIEAELEAAMRRVGPLVGRFQPQFGVGPYRLDFGFQAVKLGVECDGAEFHREPGQIIHDQRRSNFLSRLGWRLIRFTGHEIRRSAAECAARVLRYHEFLKVL